ncbi:VCBS repeat-containing protein [Yeosuana sp. MJ-SS3]|uniref:VCBS repeat-containing protein n=1 Tax=Gilvirhabdus luticola TaxID=3079858 RepID=A0ABU3U5F6_9FLAO|nr:VCBS repeat-containing protein [Yeosuana sp. MJ-SS3]MDU8885649.1 VCBS repeat-containing protein [Yeosuana sp. MJ-SS3]
MKKNVLLLFVSVVIMTCNQVERNLNPKNLIGGLELLSSERTGIDFNNTIRETKGVNHFYFSQIYNGAGVAIGDINNDGLPDIFFAGNQVSDRLYLNKGNFRFEDITKKSKTAINSGWTWGVTMADVNADGYLDIYVSRNGESMNPEDRKNQLYINNQDLTFTEAAMIYGLADAGFSTQAVFFDMDNDGDLDMYQVNQPADQKLFLRNNIPENTYHFFADRLYKNNNGRFQDVSREVGISHNIGSYGLSVNATDFNNDGWMDIYIANDYMEPDLMYYNNGDGTFKNVAHEKMNHMTNLSMGSDTGDINNDGFMDLITIDMTPEDHYRSKTNMQTMSTKDFMDRVKTGRHYQYMANALQINSGMGTFSDVADMVGLARTDWSWASLMVDLDNDGFRDILITNGVKKDVRNNDYLTKVRNLDENISSETFFEIAKEAPSVPLPNYVFKNRGDLKFDKVTYDWGFDTPSFSSGMAYGDLDNDGDLDVVINNMESPAFVYENKATGNFLKISFEGSTNNTFGYGAKAIIYHGDNIQVGENMVTRGYLSSVEPGVFFGLGKDTEVSKVEVLWPDGKTNVFEKVSANTELTAKYSKAAIIRKTSKEQETPLFVKVNSETIGIDYTHKENEFDEYQDEILLPHNVSQNGPFTSVGDVNGDDLEDIFIGGSVGHEGILYLQSQDGKFKENDSQPWQLDKASEDLGVLFLDVDGDNDLDLYVTSGGSEYKRGNPLLKDRLYINNGKGEFTKNNAALPNIYESTQCVKASDIDNDGDLDLFVGTRLISGKYGFPSSSYILLNNNGTFKKAPKQTAPDLENIGMVTDAVFTDIDKDNDDDLIIVGEWMEIQVLTNTDGTFTNNKQDYGLENTRGLWWSITADDIDKDGDDDYIIGNLGLNNKFKASEKHPFKVFVNDFDSNGTNDVVLAKFYKDDYVPVRGRECTSQQMPFIADKFKDYHSFASSKLVDILPEDKVDDAVIYEIKNFESIILINNNGKLTRQALPNQAQVSPIKSSLVIDVNNDGHQDIIIVGNHFGVEVETTRYDAGIGAILLGDGKNNFKALHTAKSGFNVPYDSRDIKLLKQNNKKYTLVISNNNKPLSLFQSKVN